MYEDTLLILVSKDLYKLQILKVKGKQALLFSGLKPKRAHCISLIISLLSYLHLLQVFGG